MNYLHFKLIDTRWNLIEKAGPNTRLLYQFFADNFFSFAYAWLHFLEDKQQEILSSNVINLQKQDNTILITFFDEKEQNVLSIPQPELEKLIREFVRLDKEGAQEVIIQSEEGKQYTIEGKF